VVYMGDYAGVSDDFLIVHQLDNFVNLLIPCHNKTSPIYISEFNLLSLGKFF
jgi:hypothetical protein